VGVAVGVRVVGTAVTVAVGGSDVSVGSGVHVAVGGGNVGVLTSGKTGRKIFRPATR
jgi:hypothetical protein